MPDLFAPTLSVSQALTLCNSFFSELELEVEGEVAQFAISRGSYVFFDLKDETEEARVGCFMMAYQLNVPLENGMRVRVTARPGIYTKSGQFRFTIRQVTPQGEGSLKRAFELLKAKLEQEGLFAATRKRSLPPFSQRIGIIASTESAGFGDFMRILDGRLPGLELVIVHVAVQGKDAEVEMCTAFDHLNSYYNLDCIALIRGGGSLEDLHAFNSEPVARAIVRSKAPVIVGVGHERDVTIADFCSDVRAATPSNAAQLLIPTREEVAQSVTQLLGAGHYQVNSYIQVHKEQTISLLHAIHRAARDNLLSLKQAVETQLRTITTLSPQQTLARGYSLTIDKHGRLIRSVHTIQTGDTLHTQLRDGQIKSITV